MSAICEHTFEKEDSNNPGYSMIEYDLYAKLNMTLRKNLNTNNYEIIDLKTKEVYYNYPTLQEAVNKCNKLEKEENTWIECGSFCPANMERERKLKEKYQ
jgi:hypothetical protein